MHNLEISCFGSLEIRKDGRIIERFETEKSRALLIYLALENKKRFPRSHLAGLFWSDLSERQALQCLRQTLSLLRKAFDEDGKNQRIILSDHDSVRLNPDISIWSDTLAFQQELSSAYYHFQRLDQFQNLNIRRLSKALAMREGGFLENFSISNAPLFDDWVSLTREDLDRRAVEGLAYLLQYYQNRGELSAARQIAYRILQITPWDESAHLVMMRLFAADQQWSAFENQYRAMRRYLSKQLGTEPDAATVAFYKAVKQHRQNAPVLHLQPGCPTNLERPLTTFIGRAKELDVISDWLANPAIRLITLHGPGGVGKTALATEIAHQQSGVYSDGVFFLTLATVQSMDEWILLVVETLKIPFTKSTDSKTRLLNYLRNKNILLIFDNFEHLLDGQENVRFVDEILEHAKGVKILITSRERLNLEKEWIYPLQGMSYPEQANPAALQSQPDYDALILFHQRARRVNPDFQMDERSLPAIIQICQLFEGLPLGIELAAAEAWNQPCQLIVEKIKQNLFIMETTASDTPVRNRNLWANMEVSWQLMDARQQECFSRLGIFMGDFSGSAAQAIGLANSEILARLVDQSLLQTNPHGRYWMHPVIRQYALNKLAATGLHGETQTLFADFYTGYLAQKEAELLSDNQPEALDEIQLELSNLQQSWSHHLARGQFEKLFVCLEPLYQFFSMRSHFQAGFDLIQPALPLIEKRLAEKYDRELEAGLGRVLVRAGYLAHLIRNNELACEYLERAYRIFAQHSLENELALCRSALGSVYLRAKDFPRAEENARLSLEYYQQNSISEGEIRALNTLGLIHLRRGNSALSKDYFTKAVLLGRKSLHRGQLIVPLNCLGDIACNQGNYSEAITLFQESLAMATELDNSYQKAIVLNNLASVYHLNQQFPEASEMYSQSMAICHKIGDLDGEAIALSNLGEVALANKDYPGAIRLLEQAINITTLTGEEWSLSVCLNNLAEAYLGLEMVEQAMQYVEEAIRVAWRIEDTLSLARFAITAGRCYQLMGQPDDAIELFRAAFMHPAAEYNARAEAKQRLQELSIVEINPPDESLLENVIKRLLPAIAAA